MEKSREITIRGIGKLTAKPDFVIITIGLEKINQNYAIGYKQFACDMKNLQKVAEEVGFSKEELKTNGISSSQHQEYIKGKYVPMGYSFASSLNLSFDFDPERLGKVLEKLSKSEIKPNINIRFTVKNKEEIKNQLLAAAAQDAKKKAEILCSAFGTKLGQLLKINYNWDVIDIYSNMKYEMSDCCLGSAPCNDDVIDFTPEDIDLTDDAAFVWEIEG